MKLEDRAFLMRMGEAVCTVAARLVRAPGGDLVSLASTNDADTLRDLACEYDEWFWDQPEGKALIKELEEDDPRGIDSERA